MTKEVVLVALQSTSSTSCSERRSLDPSMEGRATDRANAVVLFTRIRNATVQGRQPALGRFPQDFSLVWGCCVW